MPLSFAVVCEAKADKETACGLADAVFRAQLGYEQSQISVARTWQGLEESTEFVKWKEVPRLVQKRLAKLPRPVLQGYFAGKPGAHSAYEGRCALALVRHSTPNVNAVFLIRDDDRDAQRRMGLEQAREEAQSKHRLRAPVVIGLAHLNRECWVLAGFEPRNDAERTKLRELRQELGFQPHEQAHNLTAKDEHAKKSAKRVLRELTGGDSDREAACWQEADPALLKSRGTETGLADYLCEVEQEIVPLFDRRTTP